MNGNQEDDINRKIDKGTLAVSKLNSDLWDEDITTKTIYIYIYIYI